jgi:hypothetical protein
MEIFFPELVVAVLKQTHKFKRTSNIKSNEAKENV